MRLYRDMITLLLVALTFWHARPVAADAHAVLVLPLKARAFDQIETGMRSEFGMDIKLRVLLASDFEGKPGGIVEAALGARPNVIIPLGTGMSRMFIAAAEDAPLPLLCVAITNPEDVLPPAQLAAPRQLRAAIVKDGPDTIYSETADLINALYPMTARLGTVWNPAEANSVANYEHIQQEADRRGWRFVARQISNAQDIEPAAHSLLDAGVDAVFISKDRLMTSQPSRLIELCHERDVPVFCSDAGTVERFHALGTRSVAFEDLGRYIGRLARRIVLDKVDVRTLPVSTLEETKIFLSRPAIDVLTVQIPERIASRAVFLGDATREATRGQPGWEWAILGLVLLALIAGVAIVLARRHRLAGPRGSDTTS